MREAHDSFVIAWGGDGVGRVDGSPVDGGCEEGIGTSCEEDGFGCYRCHYSSV